MTKTRQWMIAAVVAIVVIMAAGWFLLVSPQRAKTADLRGQTAKEQSSSAALRTDLDVLTAQSKQLPAKQAALAKFARQIPSDPALPAMIRALQQAANTAGVALVSIAPAPPGPFTAGASATRPGPAVAAPGATPAPAATPSPAPAATPDPGAAGAVPPAGGTASALQLISLAMKVTGTYVQLEQFVANLESLPRLHVVTSYTMAPSTTAGAGKAAATCTAKACPIDLEITGQVFIAPALIAPLVLPTAK